MIVTTTPRPTRIVKALAADKDTIVTRGSTFDNRGHLARAFLKRIARRYEGRVIGRQELFAEIVEETPGALWTRALIERQRVAPEAAPREFAEVVVAVDPPARSGSKADECGLVVAGKAADGKLYVLADLTSQGDSPAGWAARVGAAYRGFGANRVVAEINNGGEMVAEVLRQAEPHLPVRSVTATRGKYLRAEPIAAAYERGLVLARRRLRQARGPALRADPRLRPPLRPLPRPRRRAGLGDRRPFGPRPGEHGDARLLGREAVRRTRLAHGRDRDLRSTEANHRNRGWTFRQLARITSPGDVTCPLPLPPSARRPTRAGRPSPAKRTAPACRRSPSRRFSISLAPGILSNAEAAALIGVSPSSLDRMKRGARPTLSQDQIDPGLGAGRHFQGPASPVRRRHGGRSGFAGRTAARCFSGGRRSRR